MNGISSLRIKNFVIMEMGTYEEQYRRPYTTELQGDTLTAIAQRVEQSTTVVPTALAGIASQFVKPSADHEGVIAIPGGWNHQRCRFMMEWEVDYYVGGKNTEIVMGYTDHVGLSHGHAIDPNMHFFVNSVMRIRNTPVMTPVGVQAVPSFFEKSHVLAQNDFDSMITSPATHRMRPEDVHAIASRAHLPRAATIRDSRSLLTNRPEKSRRSNGLPANYMATILQTYQAAHQEEDPQTPGADMEMMEKARSNAREATVVEDPFLNSLAQVNSTAIGNCFTMAELRSLDPNVDHVVQPLLMSPAARSSAHWAASGASQHWGGSGRETVIASILAQAVPALMMETGLMGISLLVSNLNYGAQAVSVPARWKAFGSMEASQAISLFEQRLIREVLNDISYNGQIGYQIQIDADLLSHSTFSMSIDGGPQEVFTAPSFCDSLFVPVLTNDAELSLKVAHDFNALNHGLTEIMPSEHNSFALPNYRPGSF